MPWYVGVGARCVLAGAPPVRGACARSPVRARAGTLLPRPVSKRAPRTSSRPTRLCEQQRIGGRTGSIGCPAEAAPQGDRLIVRDARSQEPAGEPWPRGCHREASFRTLSARVTHRADRIAHRHRSNSRFLCQGRGSPCRGGDGHHDLAAGVMSSTIVDR